MCEYVLYAADDVVEFHSLDDAIAYAEQLMRTSQVRSVVIEQASGEVVWPK